MKTIIFCVIVIIVEPISILYDAQSFHSRYLFSKSMTSGLLLWAGALIFMIYLSKGNEETRYLLINKIIASVLLCIGVVPFFVIWHVGKVLNYSYETYKILISLYIPIFVIIVWQLYDTWKKKE